MLTAEGSRIAEGLDEPRKVSSRHQEDAVEAAFSEICRDRKAAHDSTMDIRVESRLNTQARNLISLVSDSDDDMVEEREASADCLSQVLNEPFQSVSLLDAAAADTTLDMWGEPLACDASSLSPPHCRRKYSHSGHAEGRSITELNASSEPIRWSPIHMEASPTTSNWLEHILPTSADLQKGLLGQQLELGRDRDSAEGLVVLTLDDPWRDECNEDDLLMAPLRAPLKHDHATSIKMATENPVEKADVDMVDLCCSPFVNTADRRRFAVTVFEDAAVIDADSENEKDGEDGALSSESDVNEASDPSSSSENLANNSDPAEVYTLSLRERLNAIRNRTVSAGAESSSLFKSAMASCGLDSNDIGIAPASSIAGTEINVRYSNDQRNLSDDSGEPTDMVNVADDYDYFQRVEDYDFWGDDTRVTNLVTEPDIMTFDDDSAPEQSLKSRGILVPLIAGEETLLTAVAPKVSKPKNKKSTAKPAPADASSAVPPDSTYLPVGWEKHWEVVLLVDIREKENATILSNLMDCGVLCETAQLGKS